MKGKGWKPLSELDALFHTPPTRQAPSSPLREVFLVFVPCVFSANLECWKSCNCFDLRLYRKKMDTHLGEVQ